MVTTLTQQSNLNFDRFNKKKCECKKPPDTCFSSMSHNRNWRKSVTVLIFRFKMFLIETDTGYNFCKFNFKRDREKSENKFIAKIM